jgi:hypothetical protein
MFRVRIVFCALLVGFSHGAQADALAERGACLVSTIMACGNCHTPRGAGGKPIAEQAFSGGLTITKALVPGDLDAIVAYLNTVKPLRNQVAEPVYKAMVHRDPYPDAEAGFDSGAFADPVRRAPRS